MNGETTNLNSNGIIKIYGNIIFETDFKFDIKITPTKCFELLSSAKEITQTIPTNENMINIENKLIRICPTNNIDKNIKCTMNINTISKTNVLSLIEIISPLG